jgi:exportin-5
MAQEFMTPNAGTGGATGADGANARNKTPDLDGMAGMFDEPS